MSSDTLSIASTQNDDDEVQKLEEGPMETPKVGNRRSHRGRSRRGGPPGGYKGAPAGSTTPQVPPSLMGLGQAPPTPFRPRFGLQRNRANRNNGLSNLRRPRVPNSDSSFSSPQFSDPASLSPLGVSPDTFVARMEPFMRATPASRGLVPISEGIYEGELSSPVIYLSPAGTISIMLEEHLIVETSVDRSIRVVSHGNYSAYTNSRGTATSIVHPNARVLHQDASVSSKFTSINDKTVIFGAAGILFSMEHLRESYLVSAAHKESPTVAIEMKFPKLNDDYTLLQFYRESQTGSQFFQLLQDIVDEANYDRRPDGTFVMQINDMTIRYCCSGDLVIDARPRHITCTAQGAIHLRTSFIDTNIQSAEMSYIKFGMKRVHVSRSGMVVSDGSVCTSMDRFGRIIARS